MTVMVNGILLYRLSHFLPIVFEDTDAVIPLNGSRSQWFENRLYLFVNSNKIDIMQDAPYLFQSTQCIDNDNMTIVMMMMIMMFSECNANSFAATK